MKRINNAIYKKLAIFLFLAVFIFFIRLHNIEKRTSILLLKNGDTTSALVCEILGTKYKSYRYKYTVNNITYYNDLGMGNRKLYFGDIITIYYLKNDPSVALPLYIVEKYKKRIKNEN